MQSDDHRRGLKVKNFKDNDKFKVTSWRTEKKNTCEVDNDEKIKGEFNRVAQKR